MKYHHIPTGMVSIKGKKKRRKEEEKTTAKTKVGEDEEKL